MDNSQVFITSLQFWVVVIPIITTAVITIISAVRLKNVQVAVDGNLSQAKAENDLLRSMLVAKQLEIDTAEKARIAMVATMNVTPLPVTVVKSGELPVTETSQGVIVKP